MYTASNTWRWHLDLADDTIENLDSASALSFGTHSALSFRCLVIADSDLVWVRSHSTCTALMRMWRKGFSNETMDPVPY